MDTEQSSSKQIPTTFLARLNEITSPPPPPPHTHTNTQGVVLLNQSFVSNTIPTSYQVVSKE